MSTVHVLSKFLLIVDLIFKIVNSFEDTLYKMCYKDFKYFYTVYCVNWTKLMQILKRTGIDWRERRLISKLYMDQRVKVQLD